MKLDIKVAPDYIGAVTSVLNKHRGKVLDMTQQEYMAFLRAELPVLESFTISDELRAAAAGKIFWSMQFSRWAPVPESMLVDLVKQLRKKKGLKEDIPKPTDFVETF